MLSVGMSPNDKEGIKALKDLRNAGLLVGNHLAVSSNEELREALHSSLTEEGYRPLWDAINDGAPCYVIFREMAGKGLSESTVIWLLKKLTALAKRLNIISNKLIPLFEKLGSPRRAQV